MIEAYPLQWPAGYIRTKHYLRRDSLFKQTPGAARDFLKAEVRRIGGTGLIISSNAPLNKDGNYRIDYATLKHEDPGVAIYFKLNGQDIALCCDTYTRIWENVYALGRAIESMRQISRDGVSDFINRAFTGFKALPERTDAEKDIWKILDLPSKPFDVHIVHAAYKMLAKKRHPDTPGGSHEAFQELQDAYQKALKIFSHDKV